MVNNILKPCKSFNLILFFYSGPSSTNPLTDEKYGTHFPMISVKDMCDSQKLLIDHLGINKVSRL